MQLINPRLTATQNGDRWTLVASVTEAFSESELTAGYVFADSCAFWDWDDTDHDYLANMGTTEWRPGSLRERMDWTWPNIPSDILDTELGGEEIRAQMFLRNVTTSSMAIVAYTPILQISPG